MGSRATTIDSLPPTNRWTNRKGQHYLGEIPSVLCKLSSGRLGRVPLNDKVYWQQPQLRDNGHISFLRKPLLQSQISCQYPTRNRPQQCESKRTGNQDTGHLGHVERWDDTSTGNLPWDSGLKGTPGTPVLLRRHGLTRYKKRSDPKTIKNVG